MTKKDYIKFADMIARKRAIFYYNYDERSQGQKVMLDNIQDDMILIFKEDNPSFDEDRFNQYIDQKAKQLSS